MISRRTVRPIFAGIGIALGFGLAAVSEAQASTYRVYTNSAASSMTLNANDGFCSLAEAVQHANGNAVYNCTDFAPGSGEQRIELLESSGKPFSTNHFKITSLTLNRQGIQIHIFGSGGFIDSTATASAFVVNFKSIAFFERVTLTNTAGSAGGRLIENYGELKLYGVTITKGDVTGNQHATGRGGGIFNGNTQGMFPAKISFAENSVITGNKAKKGGGVYNDSGIISELAVTISNNSATLAGGGIYNISSTPPQNAWTNGIIQSPLVRVEGNTARAGGGVFNRGLVELGEGSSITGNSTTTGSSGETCTFSDPVSNMNPGKTGPCDGSGGGILSVHLANASDTRLMLTRATLANNTALANGGGVFSVGVMQLSGTAIKNNKAQNGAAMYVVAPTDGTQQYCNIGPQNDGDGSPITPAIIHCNKATLGGTGYGIVAGGSSQMVNHKCLFATSNVTSGGNASGGGGIPLCQSGAFDAANGTCPAQITLNCPQ